MSAMEVTMHTVNIKNITLGSGKPRICLPIVGKTIDEIKSQAENIIKNPVDIVEWRADWFENTASSDAAGEAIHIIRSIIGNIPLLYTIRTSGEGGEFSLSFEQYAALIQEAAENPLIDAVDVEILSSTKTAITTLIAKLKNHAAVIASSHDFEKTPHKEEIIKRLQYMELCGADICKIAVMPQNTEDVLTLLSATNEAHQMLNQPIITMSMGKYGLISRLCGEVFGSALTFGCVGKASAPGQIDAIELNTVLDILHRNL